MYTSNTEDEFIAIIPSSKNETVFLFLKSLQLDDESADILDIKPYETAFALQTNLGEKLIIVFGTSKTTIILKKNLNYKSLSESFFQYFPIDRL